jgi:hypothetical protein
VFIFDALLSFEAMTITWLLAVAGKAFSRCNQHSVSNIAEPNRIRFTRKFSRPTTTLAAACVAMNKIKLSGILE